MKLKVTSIVLVCILLCGIICAAGCISSVQQPSLEGTWILKSNPSVTLTFEKDGSYAGQAHINTYGGNYSLRASETESQGFLIFNEPFSTKMRGSDEDMNAENTYFKIFPQVVSYTIANSELTLIDENGQTLLTFIKG